MTDSTDIPVELRRLRAPAGGRSGRRRSELERLVDRTVLGPTHPELGACWLFTGTSTPYGRIAKAQDSYTHRLGWKLLRGPIPGGMELHHRCGVYACWNPDHLQVVTHAENLAFRRKPRRATARPKRASDLKPVVALPERFWKRSTRTVRFLHYGQSWDPAGSTKALPRRQPATFVARSTGCATTSTGSSTERWSSRSPTAKRSTISVTTLILPARATRPACTVVVRIRTILRLSRTART